MKGSFPSLPAYEFAWRSLQVEPVQNSGERITVAVIVKGSDQELIAAKLIPSQKIRMMFGERFGARISDAMNLCIRSAEDYYCGNSLVSNWVPPLEGFYSSDISISRAENIQEGLFRAAMHCSSYAVADEIERLQHDLSSKTATELWRQNITQEVIDRRKDLASMFQRSISIKGSGGVPIKFGFLTSTYAAQFDAIANTQGIQKGLVRVQSKLWQLDCLRDNTTLFKPERCELIFKLPTTNSEAESAALFDFLEELRYEAGRKEIKLFTSKSAIEAAEHLLECAA